MAEGASVPAASHLTSLPTRLTGDVIWAFFDATAFDLGMEKLPYERFPELVAPRLVNDTGPVYVRELPYSFDFLIENFMDPAHIPYAHHGLQGVRTDGSPIPMNTLVSNETHLEIQYNDIVRAKPRDAVLSFIRPCFYHFRVRKDVEDGKAKSERIGLQMLTVPVADGRSRLFIMPPKFPFPFSLIPTWLSHMLSNRFIDTDIWLHDTEIYARTQSRDGQLDYVLPTTSDIATRVFRKWWTDVGLASTPPNSFGAAGRDSLKALPRAAQLNRFDNHAATCSACRKALQKFKRIRDVIPWCALALVALRLKPAITLPGLAVLLFARKVCEGIVNELGGPEPTALELRSVAASTE